MMSVKEWAKWVEKLKPDTDRENLFKAVDLYRFYKTSTAEMPELKGVEIEIT